jgi:hypothetical protein
MNVLVKFLRPGLLFVIDDVIIVLAVRAVDVKMHGVV